jgi:hypothetical protein
MKYVKNRIVSAGQTWLAASLARFEKKVRHPDFSGSLPVRTEGHADRKKEPNNWHAIAL